MIKMGRYIDPQDEIRRLKDDLFFAQETVLSLMPAKVRELLTSYYSVKSIYESRKWIHSIINQLIELADSLPARSPYSQLRAKCPLCGSGSMSYYDDGFALPEGLRRHLEGWGSNIRQCSVMEIAIKRSRDYFNEKFSDQEKAEQIQKQDNLERRRKSEQLYLVRFEISPQLVDESIFGGCPRDSEGLEWADARLASLGFSMVEEDRLRRYELDLDKVYVLADPREQGKITFMPYKKPLPKQQKRRYPGFSGMHSFYLLDNWKHDLPGKFRSRLEKAIAMLSVTPLKN